MKSLSYYLADLPIKVTRTAGRTQIKGITADPSLADQNMIFSPRRSITAAAEVAEAYGRGCRIFITDKSISLPEHAVRLSAEDDSDIAPILARRLFPLPKGTKTIKIRGSRGVTTAGLYLSDMLSILGVPCIFVDGCGAVIIKKRASFVKYTDAPDILMYVSMLAEGGDYCLIFSEKSPIASAFPDAQTIDADDHSDCSFVCEMTVGTTPSSVISVYGKQYTVPYPKNASLTAVCGAIKYATDQGFDDASVKRAAEFATSTGRMFSVKNHRMPCIVDSARTYDTMSFILSEYSRFSDNITVVIGSVGMYAEERRKEIAEAINRFKPNVILTSDDPAFESPYEIAEEIASYLAPSINCQIETNRPAAITLASDTAKQGSLLLLLGKGYENYQLVGSKKVRYDDADCASSVLNAIKDS